ncbi:MAG: M64 family metallopeptidase, partial [Solimonas sp.]
GYTSAQLDTVYMDHVMGYLNYMFADTPMTDPFSQYLNFFNIYVIDVVSAQAGADDPSVDFFVDTALDASYLWDGVTQRLLYINHGDAVAVLDTALAGSDIGEEMLFVTVNSTQYGGGGGYFAVFAGGNAFAYEVALHELGHSFAGLADEYGGEGAYTGGEPGEPNVTISPTGADWSEWLGYDDPILGVVGAFEGGYYHDEGIWRPTFNSRMRNLDRPFDAIAREAFILQFYSFVDPLDGWDSNAGTRTNLLELNVDTLDPALIHVDWTVNGVLFADVGEEFDLSQDFGWGTYTITARAYDPTPWVRGDRSSLEQSVTWTVVNDYRLVGSAAAETLTGNNNAQNIVGLGGSDTINALGGNDLLDGSAGNDALNGG